MSRVAVSVRFGVRPVGASGAGAAVCAEAKDERTVAKARKAALRNHRDAVMLKRSLLSERGAAMKQLATIVRPIAGLDDHTPANLFGHGMIRLRT
jgi:hypothetical protein